MKNVMNKLKTPTNLYQNQDYIDKYSLCLSQAALRQKIQNFKYLHNDTLKSMCILNGKIYSTPNHNLPILEANKHTKLNSKFQSQDQIIKKDDSKVNAQKKQRKQKSLQSKRNQMNDTNYLKNRANQFIKKVNEQKSKLKGRLFFLKQQQQEKKNIKQQIESLEKTYIKFHYQSKRRSQAQAHIQLLTQKAKLRQKQAKSKSHLRQRDQLSNNQMLKKSFLTSNKQDQSYITRTKILGNRAKIIRTEPDQQEGPNYLLNQQDANDLQQVRKKLIILNNLMKKEVQYTQKQTHIY